MTFKELQIGELLLDGLEAMGFTEATPIQEKAIPIIHAGKDLIACAQTGTGKTAAFLLPILDQLMNKPVDFTHTLILVPTRELAIQIEGQIEAFAYFTEISFLAIYGGNDGQAFEQEKKALSQGANIIVSTPGRLIAHLDMGYVKFGKIQMLVLDEADRMLDMGFQPAILKILKSLPKKRQTLMFSATLQNNMKDFSKSTLSKPEFVGLEISKPADGVVQAIYKLPNELKVPLCVHILEQRKNKDERTLIFASTKKSVSEITSSLRRKGINVAEIHSGRTQDERNEVLLNFRTGQTPVLVATDILSRGIDVKDINLVLNFDMPRDAEDYIHRVGRTARADSRGLALTLVTNKDARKVKNVERLMGQKIPVSPIPSNLDVERKTSRRSYHRRTRHR